MTSGGSSIKCGGCGTKWELTEDGWLVDDKTNSKTHIPDWYEWQRLECQKYVKELSLTKRSYKIKKEFKVHVKVNYKDKTEIHIGSAELSLNNQEFTLYFNCSTTVDKIYNNMQITIKPLVNKIEKNELEMKESVYEAHTYATSFGLTRLDTLSRILTVKPLSKGKAIKASHPNCAKSSPTIPVLQALSGSP